MDILSRTDILTPPFKFIRMEESILGENYNKSFDRVCRYSLDGGENWSEFNTFPSLSRLSFNNPKDSVVLEFWYKLKGEIGKDPEFLYANPVIEYYEKNKIAKKECNLQYQLAINERKMGVVGSSGNLTDCASSENLSSPYEYNRAFADDLSFYVNNKFGHEVDYYQTVAESGDVIIMEWNLLSVKDKPYTLKVMVDGNEFPDSKPNYNPMGIAFEKPFEVSISKLYWDNFVGYDSRPQRGDFLYFKRTNRMYEVDSTYTFNNYSGGGVYYKIQLVEYVNRANRIMSDELKESLDSFTQGVESLFGEEIETAQTQIIKPIDNGNINTNKYTSITKEYETPKLLRIKEKIHLNWTVISNSAYDMSSSKEYVSVKYKGDKFDTMLDDRSMSLWIKFIKTNGVLFSIGNLSISLNGGQQLQIIIDGIAKNVSLPKPLNANTWYGFVFNFNSTDKNLGIYVYSLPQTMKGELIEIMNKLIAFGNVKIEGNLQLHKGDYYITGIKWLKTVIPYSEQKITLIQQKINDEQIAIILDNAIENQWRNNILNDK